MAAGALWHMPGSFGLAKMLGRDYSLRCMVFHHICDAQTAFTAGISVSVTPKEFEAALRFLTAHYAPVSLEDVLTDFDGRGLPARALLITFDDAYASVAEWAAPLCREYGVPAVFFVNAGFLDNRRLAPDNLVCYVAATRGMETISVAAQTIPGKEALKLQTLADVFGEFLPVISLAEREVFLDALRKLSDIDESRLAREAKLYLSSKQLREMASFNFEIGNHTYTHTHCRSFSKQDIAFEVDRNRAELEAESGAIVRSFSQPYGSAVDLTPELICHLKQSGYEAAFLSESVANPPGADPFHLDRVNSRVDGDETFFLELEILPRLRALRNRHFRRPRSSRMVRDIQLAGN
jgi:peptidoglycan/xylan/chitin deacetylase (PgdA/CDA1 family)